MSTSKLCASYYGYVGSTKDALLIIQEIVDKQLDLVPRRPHERERPNLIKSGNVFVFIEEHSGIKRWTDGIAWSPSRILGRFLVYRELDKHSLNEKDDKKKKKRKISVGDDPLDNGRVHSRFNCAHLNQTNTLAIPHAQLLLHQVPDYSTNQHLQGNIVTSYIFKDQGLIKKTLSLTTNTRELHIEKRDAKQTIHLISYYNADDVINGKLQRPSKSDLKNLTISSALWNSAKDSSLGGKIPIEDEAYYFLDTNYQLQNMSLLQQPHQTNLAISGSQHLPRSLHPSQHIQHQIHPSQHMHSSQKYNIQSSDSINPESQKYNQNSDSIAPGFTRHNSHPPSHQQFAVPQPHSNQLSVGEYLQYSNHLKEESTNQSVTSSELVFTNPFAGAPHQANFTYGQSSAQLNAASGPGTALPFNAGAPPYHPGFSQHQQSQHAQDFLSHYPPYSQHFPQQFGPQGQKPLQPQQRQPYNIGSTSGSSDQFSIGRISNGSISSPSSNLAHGISASNSFSGTTPSGTGSKKNHKSGSGGGNTTTVGGSSVSNSSNSGWFTTNPAIGAGGYFPAASKDSTEGNGPGHPYPYPQGSVPAAHPSHQQFYHYPSHPLTTSNSGGSSNSAGTLVGSTNEESSNSLAPTATINSAGTNSSSYGYSNAN